MYIWVDLFLNYVHFGFNKQILIKFMKTKLPNISRQIYSEDVLGLLDDHYSFLGTVWVNHQLNWANRVYSMFKDHDKAMIVIYLINKTLTFYSKNFIMLSYDEYYNQETIALEKFSTLEISKNLDIPKESTRRKLIELEKKGIIKRKGLNIIIDRKTFPFLKPDASINKISIFLSLISNILVKKQLLSNPITSKELQKAIEKNFTHIWKLFYDMEISMMLCYKKVFIDLDTWHVFGTCAFNQHLHFEKINVNKMERLKFIKILSSKMNVVGINAMSISDITGIPRATVVRKLKKLLKLKFLIMDKKKHYMLSGLLVKKLIPLQNNVLNQLAKFSSKVYNLII